jgi:type I restriction enzyme, S subunit
MSLLEQHFDVAFAAPDGIKKLRELILTLAMQGKLVPQDPKDEPASELLRSIEVEKKRLVKEGKIKQPKQLSEIKLEEVPCNLPKYWEWVRLGELGEAQTGATPPTKNSENFGDYIPFINPGDIKNYIIDYSGNGLSEIGISRARFIENNSILMVCIGGSIGKHAVNDRDITCNQQINTITPYQRDSAKYLFFAMGSHFFQKAVITQAGGSATPIINKLKWASIPVPIPPLAEQRRIVAKIDQLMARCDELEKLRIDRSQRLLTVHTAALDRLLTAKDSSEFSTAWSFITQHFGELYSVKENVVELRKTILQLAVMGKLVRQDPNDEPASELLRSIELEKQRLVKEGKIKQPKILTDIKQEEMPYELPKGWEWIRLGNTISRMDAGWSPACDEIPAAINEWGVLKTTSVQPLCFLPHQNKALPKKLDPRPEAEVKEGDMLITRAGPKNRVGICCVVKFVRPYLMLSDKIIRFRIFGDLISSDYCILCLYSGYGSVQIESMKSGMAESQVNISQEKLKQVVISLPPLAEQRLIVEKIDRLMGMCDRLEESIESGKGKQTDLLNALMSQV